MPDALSWEGPCSPHCSPGIGKAPAWRTYYRCRSLAHELSTDEEALIVNGRDKGAVYCCTKSVSGVLMPRWDDRDIMVSA